MNIELVINSIREYLKLPSDKELAVFLGVNPSAITNWKRRGSIDYDLICTKCEWLDANWLIRGEGEMVKAEKKPEKVPADKINFSTMGQPLSLALLRTSEALRELAETVDGIDGKNEPVHLSKWRILEQKNQELAGKQKSTGKFDTES